MLYCSLHSVRSVLKLCKAKINPNLKKKPFRLKLMSHSVVSNLAFVSSVYFIFLCMQLKYIDFSDF